MTSSLLPAARVFLLSAGVLLSPCALRAKADPANDPVVAAKAQADRKAARAGLERVRREIGGRAPQELEQEILRDAPTLKEYLEYLGHPRIPELEKAIFSDARTAANYADNVLESPRPEAEASAARDHFAAAIYATRVLCRPWPEAEPVIFANGNATAWYYRKFPHRITPEARERMESDPWGAAICSEEEGRRRPELEPVILKDPEAAADYAACVIKGRWPEAEAVIATSPGAAAAYAMQVIKERWIQGEPAILRDPYSIHYYTRCLFERSEGAAEWREGVVALARLLAKDPDPDLFSPALLTDSEARAILAGRPGLRAWVFSRVARELPPGWKVPGVMMKEIMADAEAAVAYAKISGAALPRETKATIARHGRAAADYAQEILKRRWPEAEPAILGHPIAAAEYAAYVLRKPWPEAEPTIALSANGAFLYAEHVLGARWRLGEPVLARSDKAAGYAGRFLHERWPEGEPAIARDVSGSPDYAKKFSLGDWPEACRAALMRQADWLDDLMQNLSPGRRTELEKFILDTRSTKGVAPYASRALNARWPEGEALILGKHDARQAVLYAQTVLRGAWPEAEPFIFNSSEAAKYAADVIKKPIPQAEEAILKNPSDAANYAVNVLKTRWPRAEPVILRDGYVAMRYALALVKERWPEAEESLAKIPDSNLVRYCSDIAKCRVPAAETALLRRKDSMSVSLEYAKQVIKGRWPEAEPVIRGDAEAAARYAADILNAPWPEAEEVIRRNPQAAALYATQVLNARWPEAEAIILRSPDAGVGYVAAFMKARSPVLESAILHSGTAHDAFGYARAAIGGAWPEGEPLIARNGRAAIEYAKLIDRRFPAGEPAILSHVYFTAEYAREVLKARWPEAEPMLMTDPERAVEYAREVLKGPFPAAESHIAKNAVRAVTYAKECLRGRFPEAEPVIAKDPEAAADYAASVLKARWPEVEPLIIKNHRAAVTYAVSAMKRRWPEAEPLIFSKRNDPFANVGAYDSAFPDAVAARATMDPAAAYQVLLSKGARNAELERVLMQAPYYAVEYAKGTLHGRWPEAEPVIAADARMAVEYAVQVIKGRWPEAEPALLKSGEYACAYAEKVIKGRWPEAEPTIARQPYTASVYAERVVKGRWPEAEAAIATKPETALHYARCVLKRRWPEGEDAIRRDAWTALIYASEVAAARWPEAEPTIIANKETATWYAVLVLNDRWPEFEEHMRKTGWWTQYALRVMRRRVPEAETRLLTENDGEDYVRAFLRERDAGVEKFLLEYLTGPGQKQQWAATQSVLAYIESARHAPWPELEKFILASGNRPLRYLADGLQRRRWSAYEASIRAHWEKNETRDSALASLVNYAAELAPGERLPEDLETALYDKILEPSSHAWPGNYGAKEEHRAFEEKFLKAITQARGSEKSKSNGTYGRLIRIGVNYACGIRGTRWPALEEFLPDDLQLAFEYRGHHADLRLWPSLEDALLKPNEKYWLGLYRASTDPEKFTALPCFESDDAKLSRDEARILFKNPSRAFRYARDVIRGRWPEFEKELMSKQTSSLLFSGQGKGGVAFYSTYRDEWGRVIPDRRGYLESVAFRYLREIVRGPLPEYEAEFAKAPESALGYALASRRDFPAGEARLFESSKNRYNNSRNVVSRYLAGLLDDPDADMDRTRLFQGPDGARFRREALRDRQPYSFGSGEPGESMLRAALEARE